MAMVSLQETQRHKKSSFARGVVTDCYQLYELEGLDDQPNVHNGPIQERNCD